MSIQAIPVAVAPVSVHNFYGTEPTVTPGKFTKYSCEGNSVSFTDVADATSSLPLAILQVMKEFKKKWKHFSKNS